MVAAAVVACPGCSRRNRVPAVADGVPRCPACHTPLPWVVTATDADFNATLSGQLTVLVDLWAPWCGPCRQLSPLVEALGDELAGRLKIVKVNIDESPRTAARLAVQSIPTLLVFRRGELVDRKVGALPRVALAAWIGDVLARVAQ